MTAVENVDDDRWLGLLSRIERQDRRIAQLEAELRAVPAAHVPAAAPDGERPLRPSRRQLVLGVAGAALAATVARAAPVAADADATLAGGSSAQFGVYASPNGVARPGLPPSARVGLIGLGEGGGPAYSVFVPVGVYGGSATGYGVLAGTTSGFAAVGAVSNGSARGVYGESISGAGANGISDTGVGVDGSSRSNAGARGVSVSGPGLVGTSTSGVGVTADSTSGLGARLAGGAGALRLLSTAGAPAARTTAFTAGTIDADIGSTLWACVAAGTPGTWRKLAGPGTAGAYHPVTPGRVYDSRLAGPTGLVGIMANNTTRTVSVADRRSFTTGAVELADFVPAGATAITANVAVVETVGSGFLTVNPGGVSTATTAGVNWFATGQILNNGQNVTLDANRMVTLVCGGGGSTHVVIDVTGYYL